MTRLVNHWLECIDERINKLHLQAAEDYMRFFEWNATDLYRLYIEGKAYKRLAEIIKQYTFEEVGMYLADAVKRMEQEALECLTFSLGRGSLHNIASTVRGVADRDICSRFKRLLDIINEED